MIQNVNLKEILEGFTFSSELFIFVFSIIFIVNVIIYDFNTLRKIFLIAASVFIFLVLSNFNKSALFVLLFVILVNFFFGYILSRFKVKFFLFLAIIFNISLLIFIKYPDLFLISHHIFVIGISFFVLNNISILVDIYENQVLGEINILDFILFLLYFPKFLMGPLVRFNNFYLELNHNSNFPNINVFYVGLFFLMIGLIKKISADYISIFPLTIYANPQTYDGFEHLSAMYGYTLYIYLDFSGYSDIAYGLSLLLGIELVKNFDYPYLSQNIREFWRRWHISLSLWIKDYIYIPLGGNKKGKFKESLNTLIAFIFSGFWHGIGLNFFIWSIMHGIALVLIKFQNSFSKYYNNTFFTFNFVALSWIFFANNLENALLSVNKIFFSINFDNLFSVISNNLNWYAIFMILFLGIILERKIIQTFKTFFINSIYPVKAIIIFLVIYLLIISKEGNIKPFVYQQF